jgi:hypothetical protein
MWGAKGREDVYQIPVGINQGKQHQVAKFIIKYM